MKSQIRLVFVFAVGAALLTAGPIQDRIRNQHERIVQGVRGGTLTAREAERLRDQECQLRSRIQRERFDGRGLSARERYAIDQRQDQLSRQIYRQKHDRQYRYNRQYQ
jgi:hypothetical protein